MVDKTKELELAGYHLQERISDERTSFLYRAERASDQQPVLLKILTATRPAPEVLERFEQEYAMTRWLEGAGVLQAFSLEHDQDRWFMVLEDPGGDLLARLNLAGQLSLSQFLALTIALTAALDQLHQRKVSHNALHSGHLLVHQPISDSERPAWQVRFSDLNRASPFAHPPAPCATPEEWGEMLPYLSPEQTGRLNRAVDHRTDLYSLGVILYELLTGQRPFVEEDGWALIHAHLAKAPTPPHQIVGAPLAVAQPSPDQKGQTQGQPHGQPQGVPLQMISDIILKLLAKDPDQRYQTAYGLHADLQQCLTLFLATGQIPPFPLGQKDVPDHLHLPQTLYGREQEMTTLVQVLERVAKQGETLLLVTGTAGVGKTALVHTLQTPVTERGGVFVTGKCDQYHATMPYAALMAALRALLRQLLTAAADLVTAWKTQILAAVEPNGQILVELLPELELFIGPQPAVPQLGPVEAQNRFYYVTQRFLAALTQMVHPLVIVLDDLQWADPASLELVRRILEPGESSPLLIIGAYRDTELSAHHPLTRWLEGLQETPVALDTLAVRPLSEQAVNTLIAETLHCRSPESWPLTQVLYAKTAGNPFFLTRLLQTVTRDGLLRFEAQTRRWQWDLTALHATAITDNVVDLVIGNIHRLSGAAQQTLIRAACLGHRFDRQTLGLVTDQPLEAVTRHLDEAIDHNLVAAGPNAYHFVHDRIQQATYALLPNAERPVVHRQLGLRLLERLSEAERQERRFEIVDHLQHDLDWFRGQGRTGEIAELLLAASTTAKDRAAYDQALDYARHGLELVGQAGRETQYTLWLKLVAQAAEAAYLCARFDEVERVTTTALPHIPTRLDTVPLYHVRILTAFAQSTPETMLALAREILDTLGIGLPVDPDEAAMLAELQQVLTLVRGYTMTELHSLPEMTNLQAVAAMRTLSTIVGGVYDFAPRLFPFVVLQMVRLSLRHGYTPDASFAYACFGVILIMGGQEVDLASQLGRLALDLLQRPDARQAAARTYHVVYEYILPWTTPLRDLVQPLNEAYQIGLDTGDVEFALYNGNYALIQAFRAGHDLRRFEQMARRYTDSARRFQHTDVMIPIELYRQTGLNMQDAATAVGPQAPWILEGEAFQESAMLPQLKAMESAFHFFEFYVLKMLLAYLFGAHQPAWEYAAEAEPYAALRAGTPTHMLFAMYDSLIHLQRLREPSDVPETDRAQILARITANQQILQRWADHAPMNAQHKYHLVEAELVALEGRSLDAILLYDQAISGAREQGVVQEEALSCELAGRWYLAQGLEVIGELYLCAARDRYRQWGAEAKVHHLEQRHADLFVSHPAAGLLPPTPELPSPFSGISPWDMHTIITAAQSIMQELQLDRLLPHLMQRMIEHAGATSGALIFETAGTLVVEVECLVADGEPCCRPASPVDAHPTISQAVVNYVWRTRETIVLEDVRRDPTFGAEAARRPSPARSLLCLPIRRQEQVIGLLYLEHALTTAAFTEDRVRVLEVVASTAAIALENARAYQALNQEIAVRQQTENALKETLSEVKALKNLLEEEKNVLQEEITLHHNFRDILGNARSLKYALQRVEDVAPLDTTVLIEGETGTGKELVARAIHAASPRHTRPLVKVNCAAIPANLLESELFGYEQGAFSGAGKTKKGRFELAHGGTLFLDEIGEFPLELQPKLLKVLEDQAFERLGGERTLTVDVRIIAATNRNLREEVEQGRFRRDVYHRLSVYLISLPPLRQRPDDIPLLVQKFVHDVARKLGKSIEIPQRVMTKLQRYSWPGNVRELRNVIERAVITTKGTKLRLADPLERPGSPNNGSNGEQPRHLPFKEMERQYLTQVLNDCFWKIEGPNGAADILELPPSTLRARMRKLNIKRPG